MRFVVAAAVGDFDNMGVWVLCGPPLLGASSRACGGRWRRTDALHRERNKFDNTTCMLMHQLESCPALDLAS